MQIKKNKITFDENDLSTLNKLKEMNRLADESNRLRQQYNILKKSAYADVELFALEKGIKWQNMSFDDKENCIIITDTNNNDDDDIIKRLLDSID